MWIKKLKDGTLIVPLRAETKGAIGDGVIEVKPGSPEYQNYLKQYEDEQRRLNEQAEE